MSMEKERMFAGFRGDQGPSDMQEQIAAEKRMMQKRICANCQHKQSEHSMWGEGEPYECDVQDCGCMNFSTVKSEPIMCEVDWL